MRLNIDTIFNLSYSVANAFLGLFPAIHLIYFAALVTLGWALFLGGLFVYINLMRGEDNDVLRSFGDAMWLYNAALAVGFILTRGSIAQALAWWAAAMLVFELLFANFMYVKNRMIANPRRWVRVAGYLVGIPLVAIGYPYDVQYSLTFGRLHFLQKPRLIDWTQATPWQKVLRGDWTLTSNLIRNVGQLTWQGAEARWICRWLVAPWDRNHCGKAVTLGA